MKTIKQKISIPYFTITILLPIIIFASFNIFITIYTYNESKNDLMGISKEMDIYLTSSNDKNHLMDAIGVPFPKWQSENGFNNETLQTNRETMDLFRISIQLSKFSDNIEFIVFDEEEHIIIPPPSSSTFLTSDLITMAKEKLATVDSEEIVSFRVGINYYHAMAKTFNSSDFDNTVIYISSGHFADEMINSFNRTLFLIMSVAVLIALFICNLTAKQISLPMENLSKYTKEIGDGIFESLPENKSSVEINELTCDINIMLLKLQTHDKMQREFFQNASHELRTPLMNIQGYAEGIEQGVFLDAKYVAKTIVEESHKLNALVDELLMLSKIESNLNLYPLKTINLTECISEFVKKMDHYTKSEHKNIILEECGMKIFIQADKDLLNRAISNILVNGIKYAKNQITISLELRNKNVTIHIADDGNGIDEKDLPHIFQRFYKGKNGNFGLGLAISKSAIEHMNGTIGAYNNNGANFEIKFQLD